MISSAVRTAVSVTLMMVVAGCAGPSKVSDLPLGESAISILDGDRTSRRYTFYVRKPDGKWFYGGGESAFERKAPDPLEVTEKDRTSMADAMRRAGWLNGGPFTEKGSGPRFLEVSISGKPISRRFTVLATGGSFDPGTEEVMSLLRKVSERRFQGVLDALPKARPAGP